jgi:hypothetical protein
MKTTMRKEKIRETVGYFEGLSGELRGARGRPFFRLRLDRAQVRKLLEGLDLCVQREGRRWFTLTSTHEKPARLRLTQMATPEYEDQAAAFYLRGEAMRISGDEGSCNINFSGSVGAPLLIERLRCAAKDMRRFLELRVPSRARNLIEFMADTTLEAVESAEHERLTLAGEKLAAEVLGAEDFSDWE